MIKTNTLKRGRFVATALLTALCTYSSSAAYREPSSYSNPQRTVTLGSSGYSTSSSNDSAVFQRAIDYVSQRGGRVNVPAGTYKLIDVDLKSNVHIRVHKNATLQAWSEGNIFNAPGTNISIRSMSNRFKVVLPDFGKGRSAKVRFVGSNTASNFLIKNVNITDSKKTTFSAIEFGFKESVNKRPTDVTVQNVKTSAGHYGYGLCQMQAAKNTKFINCYGIGGITVRCETGSKAMNLAQARAQKQGRSLEVGVKNIELKNCTIEKGQCVLVTGPHAITTNGIVKATDITAIKSLRAAKLTAGGTWKYTQQQINDLNMRAGRFQRVTVVRAEGTYSRGCIPAKFNDVKSLPDSELRNKTYKDSRVPEGYSSPSITVVGTTTSYPLTIRDTKGSGYVNPIVTGGLSQPGWKVNSWVKTGRNPNCSL